MTINFIKYRKLYYLLSILLVISSLIAVLAFGLKFGIEFTGGSLLELEFGENSRPEGSVIRGKLGRFNLGEVVAQPRGATGVFLRFREIDEATHQQILKELTGLGAREMSFETIGPAIGRELEQKTTIAVLLALLAITVYIAFAFRKAAGRVSAWQYGLASLLALFHDVLLPVGIFAVLGKLFNLEIDISFVAAILTVLGFSVHDTIVVFDRVRENTLKRSNLSFAELVNQSLNQTLGRSVNTVLTVLLTILAIFFFGGESLKVFSLTLLIGIVSGAYSSIFIASPLLVTWARS
jgi:preprotein translocase subunit SecF